MIGPGTLLMAADALHPQWFQQRDDSHPDGWRIIRHDLSPDEFEHELAGAGWTSLYVASPLRTTTFGFDRAKMMKTALKRLIRRVTLRKCNFWRLKKWKRTPFWRGSL